MRDQNSAAMKFKRLQALCLVTLFVGQTAGSSEQQPVTVTRQPSVIMVLGYNKETGAHQQATGFFMNQAGDLVTNYHVIAGVDDIKIWTSTNEGFPVTKIISIDIPADLAILSVAIPSQYVSPASIANYLPTAGEAIEVVGHPLGHQQTSTKGVVTSILSAPKVESIIQFTAPIAPGGSGSPLFNQSGQVIGIASFILYLGPNKEPHYFAIPATRLLAITNTSNPSLQAHHEP